MENNDTDDETFVDLNDILKSQLKKLYQIQINNEFITIKHIGNSSHVPDIIIKEKFGKNSNFNLYNCVYMEEEFELFKNAIDNDKLLPVIKLIDKSHDTCIYSLSVKIHELFNFNEPFKKFTVYLTYNKNDYIYQIVIDENINSSNIIDVFLETIIKLELI
jgi:hypothetical protein